MTRGVSEVIAVRILQLSIDCSCVSISGTLIGIELSAYSRRHDVMVHVNAPISCVFWLIISLLEFGSRPSRRMLLGILSLCGPRYLMRYRVST